MTDLTLYIIVEVLNIIGIIAIFWMMYPTMPLGKMFESESLKKCVLAFLIFSVIYSLFAGRFMYFLCLIFLEVV